MPTTPPIFISYARRDGRELAADLRQTLESHQFDVWQDVVAMGGGDEWWPQIAQVIEGAACMVLVLTDGALESAVVRREWVHARRSGTPILPVVFDENVLRRAPQWVQKVDVFILSPTHPDRDATERRFLAQLADPTPPTPAINMTPPQSETTVARPGLQRRLTSRLLHASEPQPRFGLCVLWGPGGFGKTTVAQAFAGDAAVTEAYTGGVLWITVGEKGERLNDSLYAVLDALKRPRPEPSNALRAVREALEGRDVLLVLDDVWELSLVEPLLTVPQCSVLITTRESAVAKRDDSPIQIAEMSADEAAQTLLKHLPDSVAPTPTELKRLTGLAKRLGGWPLLLGIFGGALREEIVTGQHKLAAALDYVESGITEAGLDAFDDTDLGRGRALNLSVDISLRRFSPDEQQRVYELGVLPEDVSAPEATITALWHSTAGLNTFTAKRLLGRLRGHFVLPDPSGGVRLHDRMREVFQRRLGVDALADAHRRLVKAWGDLHALPDDYAWRSVAYHLTEAGLTDHLRGLLLDYRWLRAKIAHTDVPAALADYDRLTDDPAAKLIRSALFISAAVLTQDPSALPHQLMGRLMPHRANPDLRAFTDGIGAPNGGGLMPAYPDAPYPTHDPAGGIVRQILHGHRNSVRCVAYSPDGRWIASGSTDWTVIVWDAHTGAVRHVLTGHAETVNSVAFSPDGRLILTASKDKTVRLWDAETGAPVRTLVGHSVEVMRAVFTPDGQTVISGSSDRTVRAWVLDGDGTPRTVFRQSIGVRSVAVSPDGTKILVCSRNPQVVEVDVQTGEILRMFNGHTKAVNRAAYSPDGRWVASGSVDRSVRVWDAQTGEQVHLLWGSHRGITSVIFSPDGRYLLGTNEEKSACLWDAASGELLLRLEGHSSRIYEGAFSPDGVTLVTAANDRLLRLWDADPSHTPPPTKAHNNGVTGVWIRPDGLLMTTSSDDPSAFVWDPQTGTVVEDLGEPFARTEPPTASPDGKTRLIVHRDHVEIVGNTPDGATLLRLQALSDETEIDRAYTERVTAAHYSADGSLILTAGLHGEACLWDAKTGEALHRFKGHGAMSCAVLSLDHRTVVIAYRDQTLWLWDVATGEARRALHTDAPVWQMAWVPGTDVFAAGDGAGRILFLRLVR